MQYRESDLTGDKLKHTIHSEDILTDLGNRGAQWLVHTMHEIYELLSSGSSNSKTSVTVKMDGSPSVLLASNFQGKPFVSDKTRAFGKNPRIAYTSEQVDEFFGHAEDLAYKMKQLLSRATDIGIPRNQIWQGDFLFSQKDLKKEEVLGEMCVTFHPNTILYAVPLNDPKADKILNSEFGIVWHTRYIGDDLSNMKMTFDVSADELNDVEDIFLEDVRIPTTLGKAAFTDEEKVYANNLLMEITDRVETLQESSFLEDLKSNDEIRLYLNTFQNYIIKQRSQQFDKDPVKYIDEMIDWVKARYDKEISTKKQQKTRDAYTAKRDEALGWFQNNIDNLIEVIQAQQSVVELKELFVRKLNMIGGFKTALRTLDQGIIPTGQEGFAVSDADGNIQKLVSRLEFSFSNFSQNVVKGWMSDSRVQERISRDELIDTLQKVVGDRASIEVAPRGSVFKVTDLENNRMELLAKVQQELENREDVEETDVRDRRDLIIDPKGESKQDWKLTFKDFEAKQSGAGAAVTALAESMQAYAFAARQSLKRDLVDLSDIEGASDLKVEATASLQEGIEGLGGDTGWVNSMVVSANTAFDKGLFDSKKKYTFHRGSSLVDAIAKEYQRLIKLTDYKLNINKWNPADVWAASEGFQLATGFDGLAEFNDYILSQARSRDFIGVSLKKVESSEAKITPYNFERIKMNVKFTGTSYAPASKDFFSANVSKDAYVYGTYGEDKQQIQFRSFSSDLTGWQGEIKGKSASAGKIGGGSSILVLQLSGVADESLIHPAEMSLLALKPTPKIIERYTHFYRVLSKDSRSVEQLLPLTKSQILKRGAAWFYSKFLSMQYIYYIETNLDKADEIFENLFLVGSSQSPISSVFYKIS